jgi:hypothetical protein
MRLFCYGLICCGIVVGMVACQPRSVWAQRADVAARSAERLELEVPSGGSLLVEADRIYLPPGSSPRAPLVLPPRELPRPGDLRGSVRVDLPVGSDRPTITEIWATGMITTALPSGVRLRLGSLIPRARITFEKPDTAWRMVVELLPASSEIK